MKKGDKVVCVDAKEKGIPLTEGETYTVKSYCPKVADDLDFVGYGDGLIEERLNLAAVELVEVRGVFMANRFEVIHDDEVECLPGVSE